MSEDGHRITNERSVGATETIVRSVGEGDFPHDVSDDGSPFPDLHRGPCVYETHALLPELNGPGGDSPTPRRGRRQEPVGPRFHSKVDRSGGPDACWPWTAHRGADGYGRFQLGGKPRLAHRIAYLLAGGTIPNDLEMRHSRKCVTNACCNPAHLVPGTHQENMDDVVAMGRSTAGIRHPLAKLTDEKVVIIRARRANGERATALAAEFGVSEKLIRDVTNGVGWRHVEASQ